MKRNQASHWGLGKPKKKPRRWSIIPGGSINYAKGRTKKLNKSLDSVDWSKLK